MKMKTFRLHIINFLENAVKFQKIAKKSLEK
jgi:hypothetical protein